jgi:hypothetical protein
MTANTSEFSGTQAGTFRADSDQAAQVLRFLAYQGKQSNSHKEAHSKHFKGMEDLLPALSMACACQQ